MLYTVSNPESSPVVLLQLESVQVKADLIKKEASRFGWKIFSIEDSFPKDMKPFGAILKDGRHKELVQRLKAMNCPIVQIGAPKSFRIEDAYWVGSNLKSAGSLAAKFFADRGFKTLAFIGNKPWRSMKETYEEFKSHGKSLGCDCQLFQITQEMGQLDQPGAKSAYLSHYRQIINWLGTLEKPVGLLTYHDYLASKLSYYCTEYGLKVPDDVAILGIGNDEFLCEASCVPISSIQSPWEEIWHEAFHKIHLASLDKTSPNQETQINFEHITERDSTNVIAVDDYAVLKSLQFIWDHYEKNIGTDDVAAEVHIHRSTLERKFKRSLGRTINEEIRRKRLEVAERLLTRGPDSVADIAKAVGFNSKNHFYAAFRKKHKMTPMEFRSGGI